MWLHKKGVKGCGVRRAPRCCVDAEDPLSDAVVRRLRGNGSLPGTVVGSFFPFGCCLLLRPQLELYRCRTSCVSPGERKRRAYPRVHTARAGTRTKQIIAVFGENGSRELLFGRECGRKKDQQTYTAQRRAN